MTIAAPSRRRADPFHNARRFALPIVLILLAVSTLTPGAIAQTSVSTTGKGSCVEAGYNVQCTQFGTIKMPNQVDIRGDAATVTITATLHDTFERAGARWVLFSVRHVPEGSGASPISVDLVDFTSAYGPVYVTSIDHDFPNEINIWVHVVDVPIGTPLELDISIGAGDRGAFRLEALAMPFDRGYEPIPDASGMDELLYSFSVLGVNKETSGGGGGGSSGRSIPVMGPVVTAFALLACVAVLRRRRA